MGRTLAALAIAFGLWAPEAAIAQPRQNRIESLDDLRVACREAEERGPRRLHVVTFPAGSWRFGRHDPDEGFLPIDVGRNLRAFGGAAELFPSHLEEVGFATGTERAADLRRRSAGLALRVAFFLGFDDRNRTLCLIRPNVGVTTVRMDVAYLELVAARGRVAARQDTDRLRAWLDDAERDAIPGRGPRGAIGAASRSDGAGIAPEAWQQAIAAANRGAVAASIGRCHAAGVARGANDGAVVVRAEVDPRTGRVSESEVELSSIGDDEEAACIARAVSRLALPAQPALGTRFVLSLPVRVIR